MRVTFDVFRQEGNILKVMQALHNSASTGLMITAADFKCLTLLPSESLLL